MKSIFKYQVPFMEKSKVIMPMGSKIIRVDGLDGAIWLWAIVDTDQPMVERNFRLFKTGGQMPDDIETEYVYLGCGAIFVQMELMMYLFEPIIPHEVLVGDTPPPFDWKIHQQGDDHAI